MAGSSYAGPTAAVVAVLDIGAREGVSLTRTKVAKLLYLADLRAAEDGVRGSSGIPWIWYNYGPWARELMVAEDLLVREGVAAREESENFYGSRQVHLSLASSPHYQIDREFIEIVAQITREYGRLAPSSLRDLTYATPPMIEAQKSERGARLDLEGRRPVRPIAAAMKRLSRLKETREPVAPVPEEVREGLLSEVGESRGTIRRANTLIL